MRTSLLAVTALVVGHVLAVGTFEPFIYKVSVFEAGSAILIQLQKQPICCAFI